MKFKLFGRLRDNDQEESDVTGGLGDDSSPSFDSTPSDSPGGGSPMSSGLEQTVENMFSQGYSEEEIKQELQGQYSEQEIQDAVSQAVTSTASGQSEDPQPMTPYNGSDENISPMDEGFDQQNQQNQKSQDPAPRGQQQLGMEQQDMGGGTKTAQMQQNSQGSANTTEVEELVETIVAENFEKVEKEFENAYSEIDQLKEKMEDLENRVHDLEVRDDEDQQEFIQKMDEIESDIDSYQSRIGGLEKAFQQVLPSLVDNVRELTTLVQEIKQEKGIETDTNVSEDDIQDMDMEDW